MNYSEKLKIYDELVALCPKFDRKGKTMPYTSANGHMFSLLKKDGELGFRFGKEDQEKLIEKWNSTIYMSHGAIMRGYVLVPDEMLKDLKKLAKFLNQSFDYVMSLPTK